MTASKPRNHATDEMLRRIPNGTTLPIPEVDLTLLEFLEELYPPRCYEPGRESLEDHLKYAGMVDLVRMLRGSYEEQQQGDAEDMDAIITTIELQDGDGP